MNVHTATNDFSQVIEEAERAAAGGDYIAAERLLRDVASQQEASLGSLHPDLANTLNNLAVVYETIDDPANAERCYRRAYAIAISALGPNHPVVATSEKNYRDFCAARGLPVEPVTPAPPISVAGAIAPQPEPRHASSSAIALLAVVAFALLVAASLPFGINSNVELPQAVAAAAPTQTIVSNRQSSPVAAVAATRKAANTTAGRVETARRAQPTLDAANLCRTLSRRDWQCTRAGRPVESGPLFFYTRIKTPAHQTVEHHWYRDDRLQRVVALRIQANQRNGFRTYSRTAVDPGDWRVEVRTRDGALLHSERFIVR